MCDITFQYSFAGHHPQCASVKQSCSFEKGVDPRDDEEENKGSFCGELPFNTLSALQMWLYDDMQCDFERELSTLNSWRIQQKGSLLQCYHICDAAAAGHVIWSIAQIAR